MPKFCTECGTALHKEFKFCPGCGVGLSDGKNRSSKSNQSIKSDLSDTSSNDDKKLDPKIFYGVLGGGLLIVLLVMYTSGSFDSPTVPEGNFNQTESQGVNLNNLQAINQLEEKLKLNPEDHESLLELAHLKNDSGLFEQAIVNYKSYLEHHPENADARIDMGVCYFNLKDYPSAIKEMEKALEYSPKHQIGHLNLGVVNLNAGNLEISKSWFQKAYDINPTSDAGQKAQSLLQSH